MSKSVKRVFLAAGTSAEGTLLRAPSPKDGAPSMFLLRDDALQEVNLFKQSYTSWFVGNSIVEDGSLYLSTPVDPLFVLLPILEKGRQPTADKPQGNFCPLEDLLMDNAPEFPQLTLLASSVKGALPNICQVAGRGTDQYYRLDDAKVVAWLACKVMQIVKYLLDGGDENFKGLGESGLRSYAVEMLGEWVAEGWLQKLRVALKLTAQPVQQKAAPTATPTSRPQQYEAQPISHPNNYMQASDTKKRPAPPTKQTPAQKAAATKMAKLSKDAKGMRTLGSFFGAK